MTTRATVTGYFDALAQRDGWQSFLADDIVFTSFTSPVRRVDGKRAYLETTKRFYSTIADFEVRGLIVEGRQACAFTHYNLIPPNGGPAFASDVAEVFSVSNGRIDSFSIYFDSASFPK